MPKFKDYVRVLVGTHISSTFAGKHIISMRLTTLSIFHSCIQYNLSLLMLDTQIDHDIWHSTKGA